MKRIFILLTLMACMTATYAQETDNYRPLAVEGKVWNCRRNIYVEAENRYVWHYYSYVCQGDTVINGMTYKKMNMRDNFPYTDEEYSGKGFTDDQLHYIGAIRDEGSRSYMIRIWDNKEFLFYDIGLQKGEETPHHAKEFYVQVVADPEYVSTDGIRLRCLTWALCYEGAISMSTNEWIEGFGRKDDHFIPDYLMQKNQEVLSCYEDDVCIYDRDRTVRVAVSVPMADCTRSHALYDLSGRRLSVRPTKGLYIEDGKIRTVSR